MWSFSKGVDSTIKKASVTEDVKKSIEKKFSLATIIESFSISISEDYEKENKKAILALDFDPNMGRKFVLAYSLKDGVFKELPIEFNNKGKLLVYCNMDENIIVIEASQLVVISIWIMIAFIMICLFAYLLIYSYFYKRLINFVEVDMSQKDVYIDYDYLQEKQINEVLSEESEKQNEELNNQDEIKEDMQTVIPKEDD